VRCPRCKYENLAIDIWCARCHTPLDWAGTGTAKDAAPAVANHRNGNGKRPNSQAGILAGLAAALPWHSRGSDQAPASGPAATTPKAPVRPPAAVSPAAPASPSAPSSAPVAASVSPPVIVAPPVTAAVPAAAPARVMSLRSRSGARPGHQTGGNAGSRVLCGMRPEQRNGQQVLPAMRARAPCRWRQGGAADDRVRQAAAAAPGSSPAVACDQDAALACTAGAATASPATACPPPQPAFAARSDDRLGDWRRGGAPAAGPARVRPGGARTASR